VHRADDAALHHALVAAGLGIGLLPALACTPFAGVRYARATPVPPRRHVAALLRRGAAQRPALAATLSALRNPAYRHVNELGRTGPGTPHGSDQWDAGAISEVDVTRGFEQDRVGSGARDEGADVGTS